MKISFLVTYFNQEDFVKRSIDSVLSIQKPCDYEILIGDDGSCDNTINIVKEYQNKYGEDKIKLFIMPREKDIKYNAIHRVSANRLNLVKNATGNYLMFLDGDDFYCDNNFLEKAINILRTQKDIVGIAHNFKYCYTNKIVNNKQIFKEGIITPKRYISSAYLHSGAILFKNIFDDKKIEFLQNTNNFDDNVITIYTLNFGNFYFVPKIIYSYTQNENSIWNTTSEIEKVLLNALDYNILLNVAPDFKKYIFKRQYGSIKKIYKNRRKIKVLLGESLYNRHIQSLQNSNNKLILQILTWNKLNIFEKIKITLLIKFGWSIKFLP